MSTLRHFGIGENLHPEMKIFVIWLSHREKIAYLFLVTKSEKVTSFFARFRSTK